MSEFVKYVMRFYGKGGIYDFGATEEDIVIATDIRLKNKPEIPFDESQGCICKCKQCW